MSTNSVRWDAQETQRTVLLCVFPLWLPLAAHCPFEAAGFVWGPRNPAKDLGGEEHKPPPKPNRQSQSQVFQGHVPVHYVGWLLPL